MLLRFFGMHYIQPSIITIGRTILKYLGNILASMQMYSAMFVIIFNYYGICWTCIFQYSFKYFKWGIEHSELQDKWDFLM